MKSRNVLVLLLAVCGLPAMGAAAQATIIDDFSSDTSSLYSTVLVQGNTASTYGRVNNQFVPGGANWGIVTNWLRNDGLTFDVGDTIGINIVNLNGGLAFGGLAINQSLTSPSSNAGFGVMYRTDQSPTTYGFENGVTQVFRTDVDWTDPITLTYSRTGDTTMNFAYDYKSTGGGRGSLTGTLGLTTGAYYFGMAAYMGGTPTLDDLSHIPEPSAIVLVGTGLIGLLAYAWRKRR